MSDVEATHGPLLLVDADTLAARGHYSAHTRTSTPDCAPLLRALSSAISDHHPTLLAAVANNAPSDTADPCTDYVHRSTRLLACLGIPTVAATGHTAPMIAALATHAREANIDVVIVTADRTLLRYLTPEVTVRLFGRNLATPTLLTPQTLLDRYAFTPAQHGDLTAVIGDPFTALPAIAGIKAATAAQWIRQHGSLAAVLALDTEYLPGKEATALRAQRETVLHHAELLAEKATPPGPIDELLWRPTEFNQHEWTADEASAATEVLAQLNSPPSPTTPVTQTRPATTSDLPAAIDDSSENTAEEIPEPASAHHGPPTEVTVIPPGGAAAWFTSHASTSTRAGLMASGHRTGDRRTHRLDSLAVCTADGAAAVFVPDDLTAEDDTTLATWLCDPAFPKAVHAAKDTMHLLATQRWRLAGVTCDTRIAAYLGSPGDRTANLALPELAARHLPGVDLQLTAAPHDPAQLSMFDDLRTSPTVLAHEAAATRLLADRLTADDTTLSVLTSLELPVLPVLWRMEATGIAVDTSHLHTLRDQFATRILAAEAAAHDVVGTPVNLNSTKQLQTILFDQLDLPRTRKTKGGYTTAADALESLHAATGHPFLTHLLDHRDAMRSKIVVDGLLNATAADNRIHTTFHQETTATGRLSSTDPNLQNIPVRTDTGRTIRQAFIAADDFDGLLTADYSQIEMRIMAHLSGDKGLIAAFNSGEDLHTFVGSRAFGVPTDAVTPDMRRRVKAMSYGLAYGLSAPGLAAQLGITRKEATEQMNAYFDRFGGVRDYLRSVVTTARTTGYTQTLYHRRRHLPGLTSTNGARRSAAERMALNAPIQGSAADIIKIAMINIDKALHTEGLRSRMLLQVHDELVFEVATGEREHLETLVRHHMGTAAQLSVPLDVSIGYGRTWDDAAH